MTPIGAQVCPVCRTNQFVGHGGCSKCGYRAPRAPAPETSPMAESVRTPKTDRFEPLTSDIFGEF